MTKVKVAAVSMNSPYDKAKNLKTYEKYIKEAHGKGVKLIVFPEMSLQGFIPGLTVVNPEHALYQHGVAECVPEGDTTQYLIKKAKEYDMYICWGMTERDISHPDALYNAAVLVGPEGFVGRHRKVHQPIAERLYFYPGYEYQVFNTKIGKIGILICFDMTMPEAARSLAIQGAEIIICPLCWPAFSKSVEDEQVNYYNIFTKARAAENMVYFIASNHSGYYGKDLNASHSRIIRPNGTVCADTGFDEGMAVAEIDPEEFIKTRCVSMALSHLIKDRRPDTYDKICEITKYNFMSGLANKD